MSQHPAFLYVNYEGQQIEVDIRDSDLREEFRYIFDRLLVEQPQHITGSLKVERNGDEFAISGAQHMDGNASSLRSALQQLKFEVIHQIISNTTNQLWLHAGAVSCEGSGVLLCGTWGKGKSTLVSALCAIDWKYMSDDIVPVGMDSMELHAFHLTPMKRVHDDSDGLKELTPHEISRLTKKVVPLNDEGYATELASLAGVIFPDYSPSAQMNLERCPPAEATMILLENCLNLKYLQQDAIRCIAGIVENVPVYRLPYTDGAEAALLIKRTLLDTILE